MAKAATKAGAKTKKATPQTGLHKEVHDIWGWVVLAIGIAVILGLVYYYNLNMIV